MFDWLRNIRQSAEEKQQERLNAYLDNALSPQERERLEQEMSQDASLRRAVEQLRQIKLAVRQMPRVAVPRNFTLSPAQVSQPIRPARLVWQPALSLATVVAAVFLVSVLLLERVTLSSSQEVPVSMSAEIVAYDTAAGADDAAANQTESNVRTLTESPAPQVMVQEAAATLEVEAEVGVMSGDATAPPGSDTGDEPAAAEAPGEGELAAFEVSPTFTPTMTMTAVPSLVLNPTPTVTPIKAAEPAAAAPISPWRLAQIGLGVLFLVLLTATLYLRRRP